MYCILCTLHAYHGGGGILIELQSQHKKKKPEDYSNTYIYILQCERQAYTRCTLILGDGYVNKKINAEVI